MCLTRRGSVKIRVMPKPSRSKSPRVQFLPASVITDREAALRLMWRHHRRRAAECLRAGNKTAFLYHLSLADSIRLDSQVE